MRSILENSSDLYRVANKNAAPANPGIWRYVSLLKAINTTFEIHGTPADLIISAH